MKQKCICYIQWHVVICMCYLIGSRTWAMGGDFDNVPLFGEQAVQHNIPLNPLILTKITPPTQPLQVPPQINQREIAAQAQHTQEFRVPTMIFQVGPHTLPVPMLTPHVLPTLAKALQQTVEVQNALKVHIAYEIMQKQNEKAHIEARINLFENFLNLINRAILQRDIPQNHIMQTNQASCSGATSSIHQRNLGQSLTYVAPMPPTPINSLDQARQHLFYLLAQKYVKQ